MKNTIQSLRASNVRFMHFRRADETTGELLPKGGLTIAFVASEKDESAINIGYALCREATDTSDKADTFNRKLGALIAGGRALAADRGVRHSEIVHIAEAGASAKELEAAIAKLPATRGYVRSARTK